METKVKRVMAMEELTEDLKSRGLGSMAVNNAILADEAKALDMLKQRMLAGLKPTGSRSEALFFAHMMASQLEGGGKLEKIAREHGLVCPECDRAIVTKEQAVHGLNKMIGTNI
jgi:hypothetical protein